MTIRGLDGDLLMTTVQDVSRFLQALAPISLAESWDNVGLLLGDPAASVSRVMTCLTITPSVVEEACQAKAEMIISHHPLFFKPVQRLTTQTIEGQIVWQLARGGIAVYSPHTAYDNCEGGINDQLAQLLELQAVRSLVTQAKSAQVKIVVFVPEGDLQKVADAMFAAGAGMIGNYAECSFRVAGTGTFFGMANANPTVGKAGRREEADEYRLEVICPVERMSSVIAALHSAHSYEEPAFDVYPLQALPDSVGAGRIGVLKQPLSAEALAQKVKQKLNVESLTLTGSSSRSEIKSVAIACGAGGSLLSAAIQAGADAFLTGEIRFHDELAAQAANMTVIAAGHYATERPGTEALPTRLQEAFPKLTVWAARTEQNPMRVI
jgi:dinuclear metal center YbgI/SA1388 family protein